MGRVIRWVLGLGIGVPLLGVAIAIGVLIAFATPQPEPPELPGQVVRGAMEHDGLERTWTVYVPDTLKPSPPLVLFLHGSSHNAEVTRMLSLWRFDELAERDGFLVAYPEGLADSAGLGVGNEWNDCRKSTRNKAHDLNVDDVGFLTRLVDDLVDEYGVDRRRIYALGISDGGQMSYRLATERPDLFAAVAIIVAQQAEPYNSNCLNPRGPISVMVINGTADPVIPFEGGEASFFGAFSAGDVQPMAGTLAHWRAVNGIEGEPSVERLPDVDSDGVWVERIDSRAASGHEVVGYAVHGGGHTLPGGWQFYSASVIGPTSRDIVAVDEIWAFFQRHRLR